MNSYIITEEQTITRQEGNTGSIDIGGIPQVLPVADYLIKFRVFTPAEVTIFERTSEDQENAITIGDQSLSIPLLPEDTDGFGGWQRWELSFEKEDEFITVGRGQFIIVDTVIKKTENGD